HHVAAVPLRRHRARALMQHGTRLYVASPEPLERVLAVPIVGDVAAYEIAELTAVGQIVDHDDALGARTKRAHDVAADEAGAARDDDHAAAPALDGTRSGTNSR